MVYASDGGVGTEAASVERTVTGATGPASGTVSEYAGRPGAPIGASVSAATQRLASMPSTVAMETNLARLPVFSAVSSTGLQLALPLAWTAGSLYHGPVRIVEASGPLTVPDMRLLAHAIKRYAEAGCPEDRRARFTLNEASRWSGHCAKGGRQLRLVRDALLRMRATAIESRVRHVDGHTDALVWGLIDRGYTTDAVDREGGYVTLSEELARFVRDGSLTYLDAPTLDALAERDEYAARLWVYLEAERIDPDGHWSRLLYSAPEREPERERDTPAIADLLRLSGWERRRDAKARIDRAMRVVSTVDPRYRYTLARGGGRRERGMWTLGVSREPGRPSLPPGLAPERDRLEAGTPSRASLPERVPTVAGAGTPSRARGYSQSRERVLPVAQLASKTGGTVVSPSVSTSVLTSSARAGARGTETRDKSREAIDAALAEGRPDIAALLERTGWSRITPKVRATLRDLADRHDLTGYGWASDRIREAPEDTAPGRVLRYVLDRDAEWREAARAEEDADLARHAERMAEERATAAAALRLAEAARGLPVSAEPPPSRRPIPPEPDPEVRARRIAMARAMLAETPKGPVAERARATLREYGEGS